MLDLPHNLQALPSTDMMNSSGPVTASVRMFFLFGDDVLP